MNFKCVTELKSFLVSSNPSATVPADWQIVPEPCPDGMNGDITVNCFRFAKLFRQAPDKIAEAAASFLQQHPDILQAERVKAFINITLKPAALFRDTVADSTKLMESVSLPKTAQKRVVIEYSAPNTNKPQHLGHVRNNTLGMSLAALLSRAGHDVVPVNLINDRGIHICKSMLAYQRFGNGASPESTGKKGDHLVGEFYVKFNSELQKQLAELRAARPEIASKDDEALFLETEAGRAAQKMLQDWEANNPAIRELWARMNKWVIEGFNETYRRMGVKFQHTYLESETYLLGRDFVMQGLEKGIFSKREDGAVTVDLGDLGEKVLLRPDGTSIYITQDLGTTVRKAEDFKPQMQIWVVGDEQILHFKMLFAALKKMGYPWAENLHHLAYGMVNLPSGRMKSREGTVVDADDLFEEMVKLAREATIERCGAENAPADIERRAELIGMGALKFMLLKFNPKTTMMFDPQASVKFEGDTGPYVQYACARINSIERKAAERGFSINPASLDWSLLASKEEKALAVCASQYPSTIQTAAERLDCSVLVNYLLDLAKAFSRFYRECPVLNADQPALRDARLALCYAARDIFADGLHTLTIEVPEAM